MRKILLPIVTVFCISALADEYVTSVALPSGETRQFKDAAAWQQIDSITQSISSIDFSASNETLVSTITGEFAKEPFSNAVLSVGLSIDTNTVAAINALVEQGDGLPGGVTTVGALLLALAAAVAALKKTKANAVDLSYSLVEVQAGDVKLSDRSMNHITYERNLRDEWIKYGGDTPEDIPSSDLSIDTTGTHYLVCNWLGVNMISTEQIPSEYYSPDDIPIGTRILMAGDTSDAEITLTITGLPQVGLSDGDVAGTMTWTDPNTQEDRTFDFSSVFYSDGLFYFNGSISFECEYGGIMPITNEPYYCRTATDENGNDISATARVTLHSVEVVDLSMEDCQADVKISLGGREFSHSNVWFNYSAGRNVGAFAETVYGLWNEFYDSNVHLSYSGQSSEPPNLMPSIGDIFIVGTYPQDVQNLVITFELEKEEGGGLSMVVPDPIQGKVRDFIVVADTPVPVSIDVSGVQGISDDTFTLQPGRNLVYVTEPVAGSLYASRKLVEEEQT